jgi:pSer/pThr/pTyr-binding forkhead associated (FHA) protein
MAAAKRPMLFMPPEPPIELRGDAPFVIGRSRSCQVRVSSGEVSRRHAEICASNGGFLLRDLASTNGSFLNGRRVTEQALQPGDRIRIGDRTLTFCQVAAVPEPLTGATTNAGDEVTILVERPVLSDGLEGDLAEAPVFALLQILELGRNTGQLRIDSERGDGEIWLDRGRPIHAACKGQIGFDAAVALSHARAGRFHFDPRSELPTATINASVTELLLEASRCLDEGEL